MKNSVLDIKGMSCVACVKRVENACKDLDGVEKIEVNLLQNKANISFDENKISLDNIINSIKESGYEAFSHNNKDIQNRVQKESNKEKINLYISFILTLILLTISMGPMMGFSIIDNAFTSALIQFILSTAVVIIEKKYFISGFSAFKSLSPNMDSLVALGAGASYIFSLCVSFTIDKGASVDALHHTYNLYYESVATILTLVSVGKYLESRAKVKTTDAINQLLDLAPTKACVLRDNKELHILIDDIRSDDIVILRAGDKAPCDGVVISGDGLFDERAITGEFKLAKKEVDSNIYCSSILNYGYVQVKVKAIGSDTTLFKIIDLIEKASAQKPDIVRLADKIAAIFVPTVIFISLVTFVTWYIISLDIAKALTYAVSVLVVSCPCALGLAAPTAVMVGTGRGALHGIIFKNINSIENLNKVTSIVFDKTGTLTFGDIDLLTVNAKVDALTPFYKQIVKSLELKSKHPLALATCKAIDGDSLDVLDYKFLKGFGVQGKIFEQNYYFGNIRFIKDKNVALDDASLEFIKTNEDNGLIVLTLFDDNNVLAHFVYGDKIKDSSFNIIKSLKDMNIKTFILSGDSNSVVSYIANKLNVTSYKGELLPEQKAAFIEKEKEKGEIIAFVGDGINDAPSLALSDIGIGTKGASDIAISTCDIALMNDNLSSIKKAINLSKKTLTNIKQNLFFAFIYNVIAIPLAFGAFASFNLHLNPMIAALMMSLSSICVVLNAITLSFVKIDDETLEKKEEIILMKKEILIDGMTCNHCTANVKKALSGLPTCKDVEVSLEDKKATFEIGDSINDAMLKSVIESLGFKVVDIK